MKSLSQMTEEELKTLCKSLEAEYGENSTVTIKQSDFNNMWASIDRYAKENKRLQKQLNDANRIIKKYAKGKFKCEVIYPDGSKPSVKLSYALNDKPAKTYIKKWKV